ncbi:heavy metal translocating P-type ATPase [Emticicia fluvialis]|uniref:heavy metal translocating P-type ATPase n=1 Tax=Emticicia fluvialis TaxID=2974474 RepID=UPI00216552C0|nr:heavy metal translocating P-type ATPase [Emticicia fluvialis]
MTHTYFIQGMSCDGCRTKAEKALNSLEGVQATVSLDPPQAVISMQKHISLPVLQAALSKAGKYTISTENTPQNTQVHGGHTATHQQAAHHNQATAPRLTQSGKGTYYCPMHCEGDKTYNAPGNCPVCGMNLEKLPELAAPTQYTCPMHPEVLSNAPGACPKCGMDLVPLMPSETDDNAVYHDLRKKMIVATAFTLPIFLIAMIEMIPHNPLLQLMDARYWNWLQMGLSLPVIFYAGWLFFERGWRSVTSGNLNMFTLIALGTAVAFVFSVTGVISPGIFPPEFRTEHGSVPLYFEAATVILTLALLGQLMEAKAHTQTSSAVKELLKLSPTDATLVRNGKDEKVSINAIQPGDLLRIKPGDKIPVDGKITEGESSIDESMITGEPIPADKKVGDAVTSGTINGNKSFIMVAEKVGSETLLAQIIAMVNTASRSKAPIQKLADTISRYFVPTVILAAVITYFMWLKWGPAPGAVYGFINAVAVLIIACPCALGLATPMSVMVGVGKGAQSGILIKNAEALEAMARVNVLIIDKTGTITEGKPSVERVFTKQFDETQALAYIAALNQHSGHPLAQAVVNFAAGKGIQWPQAQDFEAITGKGVTGTVGGKKVALGNKALMASRKALIDPDIEQQVIEAQKRGKTVSYMAVDAVAIGFVSIADAIKPGSKAAVAELIDGGMEVMMLTGDNENTAAAVARELNLTNFRASCLPEDKLNEIKRLQQAGKIVAMAGDGINDAPALVQANVGIAMGTGTDVAIESARITLVKGDLQGIVKAKNLSHAVMKNIRQNLFFAFFYNALGIPVAAGLLYPFFGVLLSPMIAAAAMSFSSVSVITNSLRLRSKKI